MKMFQNEWGTLDHDPKHGIWVVCRGGGRREKSGLFFSKKLECVLNMIRALKVKLYGKSILIGIITTYTLQYSVTLVVIDKTTEIFC